LFYQTIKNNKTIKTKIMKKYHFQMKEKSGKIATHGYTTEAKNKKEAAANFQSAQGTFGEKPKFKPVILKNKNAVKP
jgi:hypothetical protein